tara:strand:- start:384 stop:1328 length:945 start_codon:yes stop_codon:yes gene_type:complete
MLAKKLTKGDTIGIISPSSPIQDYEKEYIKNASNWFEQIGLKVVYSKNFHCVDKYGVSAGEPNERADDLNEMFSNKEIKAIFCAQGGETANQILKLIDFDNIKRNPKLFMGMSDVDVLHLAINKKTGLVVFNTPDPKKGRDFDFDFSYTMDSFKERLFDKSKDIPTLSERTCIREGIAEGKIMGCNLISMTKLGGTEFFPDFTDSILFLEGLSMNTPRVVYELESLKQLGVFDKIKGIVIGHILNFQNKERREKNNIDVNFEELVLNATKEYDFPILKINEFGHNCPNCFLPLGVRVKLDANKKEIKIIEDFLD